MASKFVNEVASIAAGAGATLVYTTPALTESIVIGFQISNTGVAVSKVAVVAATKQITGDDTPIPVGSALIPIEGKLVLEAGDTLTVSPVDEGVDVVLSILELS